MRDLLYNNTRFQAGIAANITSQLRIGIITSYNPENQTVMVTIQPVEDDNSGQSGWIPLATSFIGLVGAPNINDQVLVLFQEGGLNTGVVLGRLYSSADAPPTTVPAGEWWLTHPSGTFIKIKNNGDVDISAHANANVNAVSAINVTAPQINLSNGGSLLDLVTSAMVNFFNTHTHGGGPVPDQTMGSSELTAVVKAQ